MTDWRHTELPTAARVLRLSVMDFGALGDGRSVDTMALQKTIDEVASKGIVNGKPYETPQRNSATSSRRHIDDL